MTITAQSPQLLVTKALYGAAAGIGGGIVFGVLMAMMGMLTQVAMLVGSTSPGVGVAVHLILSAGIGGLFALLIPFARVWPLLGAGVVYGAIWWVLGPLLLMPAWLGMPIMQLSPTAVQSLMGHLIFGIVTALLLFWLRARARRS